MSKNNKKDMQKIDNLFNPNLVFNGDVSKVLDGYPERSKKLEVGTENPIAAK